MSKPFTTHNKVPFSPKQTRELLDQLEHLPNRKLGQNFLVDGNIVRKSLELAEVRPGDRVIEIGPGLGTLSKALIKAGAEVWAVERDATLAEHLKSSLCPQTEAFHLIEGDCLEYPFAGLPEEAAAEPFKIVANLPYAVSTPWMEAVLTGPLPQRMALMLQKEAGDRYIAESDNKSFGAISIFLQSAYKVHARHIVSASCFYPAPKVSSMLLCLERKESPIRFPSETRIQIRSFFTQRRKQLAALCRKENDPRLSAWFQALTDKGVLPTVRPEQVTTEDWAKLLKF
ncbi:MAG: 16S rRNA (adenine(1518)-N(6)/adenine(1519)-N(6))-dimethyltransferase RsmA [Verrucomicrobiota bacterium]